MDDYENEALPVGEAQVAEAMQTLQRYKAGKAALDKRIVDNELWFRMGHWKNYQNPMMPGKAQPSSGWLFNSIANKHADAMDNYPEPNVLPREADDEDTARALSSVLPVVLEQADYEQVYSDCWWRKLKQGTGVTGVFWDPAARGGVGDIAVRAMNLLMLYWEPGVADIQDSPDFFSLSLEDTAQLTARYPQLAGHTAGVLDVPRYIHEDGADTASRSVVVDWYYKRPDESGRMVLHYCKFCNGVVLYASQNDPALAESGLYDHGQYPFVFDPLFVEEDSPEADKAGLNLNIYWAFAEGFLKETAPALTEAEVATLGNSCFTLACELATRFLDDYITGDKYFKINSPQHNLVRTRCQIALAKDMQKKMNAMNAIVRDCWMRYRGK